MEEKINDFEVTIFNLRLDKLKTFGMPTRVDIFLMNVRYIY